MLWAFHRQSIILRTLFFPAMKPNAHWTRTEREAYEHRTKNTVIERPDDRMKVAKPGVGLREHEDSPAAQVNRELRDRAEAGKTLKDYSVSQLMAAAKGRGKDGFDYSNI